MVIIILSITLGDFCVLARQAAGGTLGTLLSLAIDHLFPSGLQLIHCGFVTFQLSALLILLSGVFITTLLVDRKAAGDNHSW